MISSDQRPPGDDWLVRRVVDLERQVRELQAGRRLEAATIGAGGLKIKGGGTVVLEDTDGRQIIQLGKVPLSDGSVKPGLVAFRTSAEGGAVAMSLFDGIFAVWDRSAGQVFATDEASGQGLARPYLPVAHFGVSLNPETYPQVPGTTSGSFTGILESRTSLTHPQLRMVAFVGGDAGGTTAEGRFVMDGSPLGPTSDAAGWISATVPVPGWGDTVSYLQEVDIRLEVRRTAGTGRAVGQVYAMYGVQS